MNTNIKSPCINICRVKQGTCIGCFRTAKEITEWWDADSNRKLEIINNAEERKRKLELE